MLHVEHRVNEKQQYKLNMIYLHDICIMVEWDKKKMILMFDDSSA